MLEHAVLRLMPWHLSNPADGLPLPMAGWARVVRAADNSIPLGFLRGQRSSSWFGCAPQRWEVYETDDASLLMSLEQNWFSFGRWRVFDAEHVCVGGVVGEHVLDERGCRFASIWREDAARHAIRGRSGTRLAWLELGPDATLLRFADDLGVNPFLRMVLLAAAMVKSGDKPR